MLLLQVLDCIQHQQYQIHRQIDPTETLYIEDIAKNLSIGKERGAKTVWLINDEYWGKKESDKEYIDYKIENLSLFLKEIRLLKNS